MLLVPVSFFASAALLLVLVRFMSERDLRALGNLGLAGLIGLYLVQSVLVSLRWGYGLEGFRLPAAVVAALIPSWAWVACRALYRAPSPRDLWALLPVLASLAALGLRPDAADIVIPLSYLGFGTLILATLWKDREPPALTPFGDGRRTRRALWLIGAMLVASAVTDGVILWDFARNAGRASAPLLGALQTGFILVMGLSAALGRSEPEVPAPVEPADLTSHAEVLARLEALFTQDKLHRSEDLSLRRLARRLGLPDRRVSEAVNRIRGINLSHYVNEHRIADACHLLRTSEESVLQIALTVGFASKSNFNREFQRVTGQTPSAWRKAQEAVAPVRP